VLDLPEARFLYGVVSAPTKGPRRLYGDTTTLGRYAIVAFETREQAEHVSSTLNGTEVVEVTESRLLDWLRYSEAHTFPLVYVDGRNRHWILEEGWEVGPEPEPEPVPSLVREERQNHRFVQLQRPTAHEPGARSSSGEPILRVSDLTGEVLVGGQPIQSVLGPKEWRLLFLLKERAGETVTSSDIAAAVWPTRPVTYNTVCSLVFRLRTKLEAAGERIENSTREGYRLKRESVEAPAEWTADRVANLPPGAELDALIAIHIMGWSWVKVNPAVVTASEQANEYRVLKPPGTAVGEGKRWLPATLSDPVFAGTVSTIPYSTDLSAFWDVVTRLRDLRWLVTVKEMPDALPSLGAPDAARHPQDAERCVCELTWVGRGDGEDLHKPIHPSPQARADSAPLAVGRAGLLAVLDLG
jgi:DNA-binding winged helix-turn-helix (wHTH) protein